MDACADVADDAARADDDAAHDAEMPDDAVAGKVCELEGFDRYRADFVMEGGAIHVDGQGTVLVTEQCLLNPNRNPQFSRGDVEQRLRDWLGAETVVWLGEGVYLDETDGHIDNLACFTAPATVALTWTDNRLAPRTSWAAGYGGQRIGWSSDPANRRIFLTFGNSADKDMNAIYPVADRWINSRDR